MSKNDFVKPAIPADGVIVVSRTPLDKGSMWVVAGEQEAKAKGTWTYVLVRLEVVG